MNGGIGDWIERRADRKPGAVALIDGDNGRRLTYGALRGAVAELAGGLHELGVRRGDRIAVLMENSPEMVEVLFAAANLGVIVVPVNFRLAAAEIGYVLADSGAVLLVVSERFRELADDALGSAEHGVRRVVAEADLPALRTVPGRGADPLIRGEDLCVLMYTSGTTGRPKGAMLTHANMQWNAINLATVGTGLCGSTVTMAVAPMFHIGGLGLSVLPILYAGGTVITVRAFDPARTLTLMSQYRVTTQFMVPAMWAALARLPEFDGVDVSAMQFTLCGGAPCPLPVIEFYQRRGWQFLEGFGMTEASPNTLLLDAEFVVAKAGSVGRPFMHVDVRIVDEQDHDVSPGQVGELVLRGPNIFAGYWGLPAESAAAMRGGWFHTGDLGRADEDGFITLVDRKKDMIISGGENVYPIEVEQVLHRHPAVADVAVIGLPDARWGETVCAVVVPAPGSTVDGEDLIGYARDRIAHFKSPRRVEFVDELPRTATGKVLKRELRTRYTGAAESVHR